MPLLSSDRAAVHVVVDETPPTERARDSRLPVVALPLSRDADPRDGAGSLPMTTGACAEAFS